jgi:transcription elongation factor SPT5
VPLTKQFFVSSQKEHGLIDYLKQKYGDESSAFHHFDDDNKEMGDEMTQQSLLPTIKDPNLWAVKCRKGAEKSTALLLMRKCLTYQFSGKIINLKEQIVI